MDPFFKISSNLIVLMLSNLRCCATFHLFNLTYSCMADPFLVLYLKFAAHSAGNDITTLKQKD